MCVGRLTLKIIFLIYPLGTSLSAIFRGRFGFGKKGHMVMPRFYQQNVFESCLKISARLRAEILQIRVKTGHFGVKTGITISSS